MNAILNSALPAPSDLVAGPRVYTSKPRAAVLCGVSTILLLEPLAFGGVDPWAIFVLEFGAAGLLVFWAFQQARLGELRVTASQVFAPMLAFAGLIAVQYFADLTAYRYATGSAALLLCAQGILCFLMVQTLQRTSQVKRLGLILSMYGFAVACFAVLQSISAAGKIYWVRPAHGGWIYGPYVNHNHYAGLMELLFPIPLVISLGHFVHARKKALAAIAAGVMASTIILSGSRGGMAALAVQVATIIALVARKRVKARRNAALPLAVFVVVMFGAIGWIGGGDLAARLSSIHSEAKSELSGGTRITIDRDALRMFSRKPLLGWGLAAFPEVYPEFRSFYTDFFVNAAHNDYLQLLVETGALGFAIMIWFLVATFRSALPKLNNWSSDTNGAVAVATMVGITGLLVHSLVDFNLQIPANASLFFAYCTVAAMPPHFGRSRRRSNKSDLLAEMTTG